MRGVTFYIYCKTLDSGFSFMYIRPFGNYLYSLRRVTVFRIPKKIITHFKNIRTRVDCNWDVLNNARLLPSRGISDFIVNGLGAGCSRSLWSIQGSNQKCCLFSKNSRPALRPIRSSIQYRG